MTKVHLNLGIVLQKMVCICLGFVNSGKKIEDLNDCFWFCNRNWDLEVTYLILSN